ncbi:MAG: hypothetical protein J6N18_08730 [Kiritimatiellae bacterium]|nr:hypothetical protein [Kiritimatiellia bacterium]
MKLKCTYSMKLLAILFIMNSNSVVQGSIQVTSSNGDISTKEFWPSGNIPESDIVVFAQSGGKYTATADVTLGSVRINQSTTLDLESSGNHTIKTSKFYIGYQTRAAYLKGGMVDLSGVSMGPDGTTQVNDGDFMGCVINGGTYGTIIELSGCIVTNVNRLRIGNGGGNNQLKITNSSRVHSKGSFLWAKSTAGNGLLEVSSGGQLYITGSLYDGYTDINKVADTTNRIVVTGNGSKVSVTGNFYIGSDYGRNSVLVSEGGELIASTKFSLGNGVNANTNSAVFEKDANFWMRDINVGEYGSCGNVLEFRSGAFGTIEAGGRVGGWKGAGSDNMIVVSNATVSATGVLGIGAPSSEVDVSKMSGNGLVIQGRETSLSITSSLLLKNRSYLRIEVPSNGYADGFTPLSANKVTFDDTSSLDVVVVGSVGFVNNLRLVSAPNGITVSEAALAAANANLFEQTNGRVRLAIADGGNAIDLRVSKGMVVSLR